MFTNSKHVREFRRCSQIKNANPKHVDELEKGLMNSKIVCEFKKMFVNPKNVRKLKNCS